MCSSSRSVIYTGQHVPMTEIFDNHNMPYIRPLDPTLGTLGTMLGSPGYYCTYQGKWHLSKAYADPSRPRSTTRDLEPFGFHEWNDRGDIDGGAWAGLRVDPLIAGRPWAGCATAPPRWPRSKPWLMAVNFVNTHDIMSFDFGGKSPVHLPEALAHAVVTKPPANVPLYDRQWDVELPDTWNEDLAGAPAAVRSMPRSRMSRSVLSRARTAGEPQ